MCGNPFKAPKIPDAPPMPEAPKAAEAVKMVSQDQTMARDQTLRKMAQRMSLANTNTSGGKLGSMAAAVSTKTLLGQ